MKNSVILKSFTVRLALVYIGLFGLSVILLFGFIYAFSSRYVDHQIDTAIESQFTRLHEAYRRGGAREMERIIDKLVASDEEGTEIYIVTDRNGKRVAGNLEALPKYGTDIAPYGPRGKWIRFSIEGTRNHPYAIGVRAIVHPLSRWRKLLVGESLLDKRKLQQTIIQTFWASLLFSIIIACIGALLMARTIGRRISIINRSAQNIMDGDMSARIPETGGRDEFDVLSKNLNNMLDKIELLLKSLSEFSNNIAHDLRTPLNRIIARTEAGLRELDSSNSARQLLSNNVEDMQGIIGTFNAILKISELEAGGETHHFKECNVVEIVEDIVALYEPIATEKQQNIIFESDSAIALNAEPKLLAQALANLLDNAIKFSPEKTDIIVELVDADHHVLLSVADEGPGIPESKREKVFDKFVRLEDSRSQSGNGLGLSLVAAIARIHSANITLEDNNPGLKVVLAFSK